MQEATQKAVFTSLCIQTWHTVRKEQEKISKYLATTSQRFKTEPTIRLWNIHCIWGTPIFSSLFTLHLGSHTDTDTQSDRHRHQHTDRQIDRHTMKLLALDSGYIVLGQHSPQWPCIYEAAVAVRSATVHQSRPQGRRQRYQHQEMWFIWVYQCSTLTRSIYSYTVVMVIMKSSIWVYYK